MGSEQFANHNTIYPTEGVRSISSLFIVLWATIKEFNAAAYNGLFNEVRASLRCTSRKLNPRGVQPAMVVFMQNYSVRPKTQYEWQNRRWGCHRRLLGLSDCKQQSTDVHPAVYYAR
jgi:hypothetical protein